jgi:O-acetyl-ADP-ribose deacetylase (regulator of RNase III)
MYCTQHNYYEKNKCNDSCEKKLCESVAIPAISSGIFGFPKPLCAQLMFDMVIKFVEESKEEKLDINFTNFDDETVEIF